MVTVNSNSLARLTSSTAGRDKFRPEVATFTGRIFRKSRQRKSTAACRKFFLLFCLTLVVVVALFARVAAGAPPRNCVREFLRVGTRRALRCVRANGEK